MKTKYYFIPKSLEELFSQMIENFLITNEYTIITGVFKPCEILDNSDILVENKNILNEISFIKNGFKDPDNNIFGLIGFCLEANFSEVGEQYNVLINQFPEILQFNNSKLYLKWYNSF